jgi:hypothetical protein
MRFSRDEVKVEVLEEITGGTSCTTNFSAGKASAMAVQAKP